MQTKLFVFPELPRGHALHALEEARKGGGFGEVELLRKCMATVCEDPTTYDLLKAYLLDEEEDQYWSEEQLELIEKIGYQNWLMKQM